MSRTKRRKNVSIPDYRLMDYVFDETVGYWKDVPYADDELKKLSISIILIMDDMFLKCLFQRFILKCIIGIFELR